MPVVVPVPVDQSVPIGLRPLAQVLTDSSPSPFQLRLQYTGEAWQNSGGLQNGNDYMANYFATLSVNTDKAFGWTGGRFVVSGFYNSGPSLNEKFVGAFQDPSVIDVDGPNLLRLYQIYYDQIFGISELSLVVIEFY